MTAATESLLPARVPAPPLSRARARHRPALAGVLLVSAALNLWRLNHEGYANTYYAAAVKSMLQSWHNFFFVAFDPGGFVAVDKPPVGLWVQVAFARVFGFHGVVLLLPQALAGVASVAVLYALVRRTFGVAAGLIAALALALSPISVVVARNNTMDGLLVLVLLLAAWAVLRAAETGQLRWLLAGAALVGVGFNIKMLQAYPVVPAFWLAYLVAAPVRRRTRLLHLAAAGVLLLIVSLSWSVAVDLTPAAGRPYVGSSGTNSELSLALGYNGLGRVTEVLANRLGVRSLLGLNLDLAVMPGFAPEIGDPSALRLFDGAVATQATWLLPLALFGLLAAAWQRDAGRVPTDAAEQHDWWSAPASGEDGERAAHRPNRSWPRRELPWPPRLATVEARAHLAALVLWAGWLLAWGVYFSTARFFHLYYLVMLPPAIAALTGIGLVALWRDYRRPGPRGWLLPAALLATAGLQAHLLGPYTDWNSWLRPLAVAGTLVAAGELVKLRLSGPASGWIAYGALAGGAAALLAAPALWSAVSVRDGNGGAWLPQAGPNRPFAARNLPGFAPGGLGSGGNRPAGDSFAGATGNAAPPSRGGAGGPGAGPGSAPAGSGAAGRRAGAGSGGQPPGAAVPPGGQGNAAFRGGFGGGAGALTFAGADWNVLDPRLVQYLRANQRGARYLVATPTSTYASLFILLTGQPVMALGGYQGWDQILSVDELVRQVQEGAVRFFYASPVPRFGVAGPAGARAGQDATAPLIAWVQQSCRLVPATAWQAVTAMSSATAAQPAPVRPGGLQLYDCAVAAGPQP